MSVIVCPGIQFLAEISWSSAHSPQVCFIPWSVSIFLTYVLSVLNPFTSPLYHIHDENIHFLNNFILLAQSGSEAVNIDDGPSSSNAKHRPYMPYDYQGSSSCTLEDAAASLCSSEPDHSGIGNTHVTCHVGMPSCGQRHRNMHQEKHTLPWLDLADLAA